MSWTLKIFYLWPTVPVQRHFNALDPTNSSQQQKVSEGSGDLFIFTDSVIIYIHFQSNQPPVSKNKSCSFSD